VVADLVYHPLETGLLRAARAAGALAVDGLGMLVHQAVLQQELWTGRRPDPLVMRAAAELELARRAG
jgi:shikimate dehydrogenase